MALEYDLDPFEIDEKRTNQGVTALGSHEATGQAGELFDDINVLVDQPDWSWQKNRQWLLEAIDRGDDIWLLTDPKIWRRVNPNSVYLDELDILEKEEYNNVHKIYE